MAKVTVKDGVQPHLIKIVVALGNIAANYTSVDEFTITSGIDGKHSPNSLHYALRAIDIRTRTLAPDTVDALVDDLRDTLGAGYDVVLEDDHIHVEFDP